MNFPRQNSRNQNSDKNQKNHMPGRVGLDFSIAKDTISITLEMYKISQKITYIQNYWSWIHAKTIVEKSSLADSDMTWYHLAF